MTDIWVYLSTSPLLWLTITLVAYQAGLWLHQRAKGSPVVNPVMLAVLMVVGLLSLSGTDYQTYFNGAQFVHFLLGPATVALAVPLYRQLEALKQSWFAIALAIICGCVTSAISAVAVGWVLGASTKTLASLAPKSATTPIAMGVSDQLGGLPSLTAVLVILTGILGAMLSAWVLDRVRVFDWQARGIAMGTAAHGVGTARAMQVNDVAGAFSGLAMGLNGLATAVLLPLLAKWLLG